MNLDDQIPDTSVYNECVARGRKTNKQADKFERENQIDLCAKLLKVLQCELKDNWAKLGTTETFQNKVETKNLIKHLIRISSESVDFPTTVDFITKNCLQILQESKNANDGIALKKHLYQWEKLSHEHMVPCEAVLAEIIQGKSEISKVLNASSFRALVTGPNRKGQVNEVRTLDGLYSSTLPDTINFDQKLKIARQNMDIDFLPLLRYEEVNLFNELIPISDRAKLLLIKYKDFKNRLDLK